ncbi:helix-turn-helix domain-containing protein [Metabacillus elymi]|uniref:Helix-turn-helix domain-containing protein n=1 Tax=Metabacillus elymi TaxID=2745198 RepID=A0ABX6S348_9BACI|nr:helix-turn-helix domain-containing protein [Metabacillus sp. KUDC1714]QNF28515.1 helix-turn-helix domain-containing protein [Metabacillus sp. KUDC1714]
MTNLELQNLELLDVKDVQAILQIGRRQTYELVHSNVFYSVRVGRRIKISKQSFLKWLNG